MRHHARIDAQAFRMGWLAVSGKIEPEWSATWREYRGTRGVEKETKPHTYGDTLLVTWIFQFV